MAKKNARQQIVLRVPSSLKTAIRKAAKTADQSLNNFVETVLAKRVGVKLA